MTLESHHDCKDYDLLDSNIRRLKNAQNTQCNLQIHTPNVKNNVFIVRFKHNVLMFSQHIQFDKQENHPRFSLSNNQKTQTCNDLMEQNHLNKKI